MAHSYHNSKQCSLGESCVRYTSTALLLLGITGIGKQDNLRPLWAPLVSMQLFVCIHPRELKKVKRRKEWKLTLRGCSKSCIGVLGREFV